MVRGQEGCDKEGRWATTKGTHEYGRLVSQPQESTVSVLLSFTFGTGSHLQTELEPTMKPRVASSSVILSKCYDDKAWVTILDWAFSWVCSCSRFASRTSGRDTTMFHSLRTGHLDHETQTTKTLASKGTKFNHIFGPKGSGCIRVSWREKMKILMLHDYSPLISAVSRMSQ